MFFKACARKHTNERGTGLGAVVVVVVVEITQCYLLLLLWRMERGEMKGSESRKRTPSYRINFYSFALNRRGQSIIMNSQEVEREYRRERGRDELM